MSKPLYSFDRLHPDAELPQGLVLMSKNQAYFAMVQPNGEFSIYVSGHFVASNKIWYTKDIKKGIGPYKLCLKTDGNLVMVDNKEVVIWETGTNGTGKTPFQLILQDDGNLVLYNGSGSPVWCVGMIDR